jgi:hypothetical protein
LVDDVIFLRDEADCHGDLPLYGNSLISG